MPVPEAPSVRLIAMSPSERDAFLARESIEYADQKARAGFWAREESLARAREEIEAALRSASPENPHRFYRGVGPDGRTVGEVWLGPVPEEKAEPGDLWLYQIIVAEDLRGRGYGRALLASTEAEARARGGRRMRLNVFTWNRVAIGLYRASGYEVAGDYSTALEMRKPLV